jgi:hypothetical protein
MDTPRIEEGAGKMIQDSRSLLRAFLTGICMLHLLILCRVTAEEANCTTLLEMLSARECQICPACERRQACAEGYSCQPDKNTHEGQLYPSSDVELWVQSIVAGVLNDVPVDDPRWAKREAGEVYARENSDFIVFYWPKGGEAVFDTTKIGSRATWHDFRAASGASSSGGPIALSTNMEILFRDAGGGVTIFERDGADPHISNDFLKFYVSPERDALPAHRNYPLGQRMMLTAWNPKNVQQVNDLYAHGFTAIGPFENAWPSSNTNLHSMVMRADELGMRTWLFLHNGFTQVHKLCDAWDSGKSIDATLAPERNLWSSYYGKDLYKSTADAYILLPEELSHRLHTCSSTKLLEYTKRMVAQIQSQVGDMPIIRTEVEGNNSSDIQKTNMHNDVAVQHYFEHHGTVGKYKHAAVLQVKNRDYLKYMDDLDKNHPLARPRLRAILMGAIYEPKDDGLEAVRRYAEYYLWTSLIQGFNSFSLYKLDRNVASGKLNAAYMDSVKQMTDLGFDQAFLWGTRKPYMPLSIRRVDGPEDANWSQGLASYKAESMLAADIQYEDKRYVAITNSHWNDSISVKISGLPTGEYILRDGRSGKVGQITTPQMTISIEPNGYAVYRIERK